jgi:5,6,7,8-tetrahydromethanopterin hydro-lyase
MFEAIAGSHSRFLLGKGTHMALINKMLVGESLVGDGNEVAHIDLIMGPRGSAAELAFANALVNNKDGFTTLLAVVAPNLLCKPNSFLFN